MSSTSKYNPFGANSISSSWEDKMVYKYNVMKEYIKLTKRDALVKEYEQSRFLGVMVLGFVGGYFAAFALTTYIHTYPSLLQRGRNIKTNNPAIWDPLLYGALSTSGFGYQYLKGQERYNKTVCWYILNKYLPLAV